jgi:hypothetical protein
MKASAVVIILAAEKGYNMASLFVPGDECAVISRSFYGSTSHQRFEAIKIFDLWTKRKLQFGADVISVKSKSQWTATGTYLATALGGLGRLGCRTCRNFNNVGIRRFPSAAAVLERLSRHALVYFSQDCAETLVDVCGVQRRSFKETEAEFCAHSCALSLRHLALTPKIALITNKHDADTRVGVLLELLDPTLNAVKGGLLGDVIHKEGTEGAAIVSRGDRAVALLPGSVPYLGGANASRSEVQERVEKDKRSGVHT